MDIPHFYVPDIAPGEGVLSPDDSRHCTRVLRLGLGDRIDVTDGRGTVYGCSITVADQTACAFRTIECAQTGSGRNYSLTLAVAPTKNLDRFEWFVEKATEIGCDTIIPVICQRSERRTMRNDRLERIITGAMKQSRSTWRPLLEEPQPLLEAVARAAASQKFIAHCDPADPDKKDIAARITPGSDYCILIGPEGDFSPEEIKFALDNGFCPVSLGPQRLRTETAAVAVAVTVSVLNRK